MSRDDQYHWDAHYQQHNTEIPINIDPVLSHACHHFPTQGTALDLACGLGGASIWFSQQGLEVYGYDISPIAIQRAQHNARQYHQHTHCHFAVADFDHGLPQGPQVEMIYSSRFHNPSLDQQLEQHLTPGGIIALTSLSIVGGKPGNFRAQPGELPRRFHHWHILSWGEENGITWIVAQKPHTHHI